MAGPAGGVLAVWNPYVIERLALGQWALLLGYGALFWVARIAMAPGPVRPTAVLPWLLLAALTPTGALLAGGLAILLVAGRRQAASVVTAAVLVQLPWVLPSVLSTASKFSDWVGFEVFAARAERPGPALGSLVGLGGAWDRAATPGSLTGLAGHLVSGHCRGGPLRRRGPDRTTVDPGPRPPWPPGSCADPRRQPRRRRTGG